MKLAKFLGDSRSVIRSFPEDARRETGFQIDRLQRGLNPDDWKPMKSVAAGVREIRIREESGAFRVIYTATIADYIYVLHAFHKKSQETPKRDIELARIRLAMLTGRTRQ